MGKVRTRKQKIGEIEIDAKDTPKAVDFCRGASCENIVKEHEYFEQNGLCVDCFRGYSFEHQVPELKDRNCTGCNEPMTAFKFSIWGGLCDKCDKKKFDQWIKENELPEFPF